MPQLWRLALNKCSLTFCGLTLLDFFECVVESRKNIEEKHEKLNLWPVFFAEGHKREEIVVNFTCVPGPGHGPCFAFALMEILERLRFFLGDDIEFGVRVMHLFDLLLTVHSTSRAQGVAS